MTSRSKYLSFRLTYLSRVDAVEALGRVRADGMMSDVVKTLYDQSGSRKTRDELPEQHRKTKEINAEQKACSLRQANGYPLISVTTATVPLPLLPPGNLITLVVR